MSMLRFSRSHCEPTGASHTSSDIYARFNVLGAAHSNTADAQSGRVIIPVFAFQHPCITDPATAVGKSHLPSDFCSKYGRPLCDCGLRARLRSLGRCFCTVCITDRPRVECHGWRPDDRVSSTRSIALSSLTGVERSDGGNNEQGSIFRPPPHTHDRRLLLSCPQCCASTRVSLSQVLQTP